MATDRLELCLLFTAGAGLTGLVCNAVLVVWWYVQLHTFSVGARARASVNR